MNCPNTEHTCDLGLLREERREKERKAGGVHRAMGRCSDHFGQSLVTGFADDTGLGTYLEAPSVRIPQEL